MSVFCYNVLIFQDIFGTLQQGEAHPITESEYWEEVDRLEGEELDTSSVSVFISSIIIFRNSYIFQSDSDPWCGCYEGEGWEGCEVEGCRGLCYAGCGCCARG